MNIKEETYRKALAQKRLILPPHPSVHDPSTTKSSRNASDDQCSMGKSCSNEVGRILASRKGISATPVFSNHLDLSHGGILLSLPALLACGLLSHAEQFSEVKGYYTAHQVLVSLAFLMLLRKTNLERSNEVPSGELGRCLGLDRIPDVKTLRERIAAFCGHADLEEWSSDLSRQWMQKGNDELNGVLYVDGHVRLYYGSQADMPKRFVSRMRLCLSGSTDYWVNDRLGQPFFVVNKTLNEGMIKALTDEIIPRLDREVAGQPSMEELAADSQLHRYMLVFDRECYSIDFFKYLQERNIAFCTYRKNVKEEWPDECFSDYEVVDENGDRETMRLAEATTTLYGTKEKGKPKSEVTVREIRKKSNSGHQTAIITTNYKLTLLQIATLMFARWCQENFFKYMVESFDIDSITSYSKSVLPDTSEVINPRYKELDKEQKRITTLLKNAKLKYAEASLCDKKLDEKQMEKHIKKKANIKEDIDALEKRREDTIEMKKTVGKKIFFKSAFENQQFITSVNERKFFLDTIKIIAYRAETAMVNLVKKEMASPQKARSLVKRLYQADADIHIDKQNNILNVHVHRSNNWADDKILYSLCQQLNATKTVFPETSLIISYDLVPL